ncbi:unnamed protein product, partial [Hapterophycus canaliculatus]
AKTEAKLLLSVILDIPTWRCSLDLGCEDASKITAILLKEEAESLDRTASSATIAEVPSSGDELRRRCLVPLLESSEGLRNLALTSGLVGDLCVALEALLGRMAVVGHGRETLHNASRHLETLKAKAKKAGGGNRLSSTAAQLVSPPTVASCPGDRGKALVVRKPPVPTANGKTPTGAEPLPAADASKETASRGKGPAAQRARKPFPTKPRARRAETTQERSSGRRWSWSTSSVSPPPPPLPSSRASKPTTAGIQAADEGAKLEREFYTVAALIVSTIGGFPEGQREALRLRVPQFLWKAWPSALASQLAHGSTPSSHHHLDRRTGTPHADGPSRHRLGSRPRGGAPLLLQALLGLASCVANGFPEGKKAFVFAGPEGSSSPDAAFGAEGGGEWPRSARSLLHRVAALALSSSPSALRGGRAGGG